MTRILPGMAPLPASVSPGAVPGAQADFLGALGLGLGLGVRERPGEAGRQVPAGVDESSSGSLPGWPLDGERPSPGDQRPPASAGVALVAPPGLPVHPLPASGSTVQPFPGHEAVVPRVGHAPAQVPTRSGVAPPATPPAWPAAPASPQGALSGVVPVPDLRAASGSMPVSSLAVAPAPVPGPAPAIIAATSSAAMPLAAPEGASAVAAPSGLPSLLLPQGLVAHGRLSYLQRGEAAAHPGLASSTIRQAPPGGGASIGSAPPPAMPGVPALSPSGAGAPIAQAQAQRAQDANRRDSRIGGPDAPPAREALASSSYARRALHTQVDEDGSLRCWARDYTLSEHEREGLALGLVAEAASRGQSLQRVVINGVLAWQRPQD